jgi:peptidoglycan/xylan/chitin deacetylase (PgdA/CDA1 family)
MKLVHLGVISTGTIIVIGLAMVVPAFTQHNPDRSVPSVMLSFSILDSNDVLNWCKDLSSVLEKHGIRATVFVSGKTAESDPECVTSFSSGIDIGSQTYSYANLTSIPDYTHALEEVKMGKQAVDAAGNLNSRLFKAPYGATDDNIYSLLSRSDILADFSYASQYNKYEESQFVRYDLKSLRGDSEGLGMFSAFVLDDDVVRPFAPVPIAINFDSSMQVEHIDEFISKLKSDYGESIRFANASDLIGTDLTVRTGEQTA